MNHMYVSHAFLPRMEIFAHHREARERHSPTVNIYQSQVLDKIEPMRKLGNYRFLVYN